MPATRYYLDTLDDSVHTDDEEFFDPTWPEVYIFTRDELAEGVDNLLGSLYDTLAGIRDTVRANPLTETSQYAAGLNRALSVINQYRVDHTNL